MNLKYLNNEPQIDDSSFIASGAYIIGNVKIHKDASVWFNTVIRGDDNYIEIGEETNIQDLSCIHVADKYPTIIGKGCSIGHSAVIHGCKIGDNTLIGIHATILDNASIGKNCVIGANSLVTANKVIPDNSLVFGNPAKVIRQLTDEEINHIKENADHYVKAAKVYLNK